ncbi:hypothetical protein NDU88_003263 [Pleurodeles waltl]|uniref:Uncharacterized protein n=1 Tax=Pleurodeles waltl TaxID=8319 RepID=A0AAV7VGY4_PLEWA|nr:hypothetical protein NDU88_003263 [Pleurodeles waltl]
MAEPDSSQALVTFNDVAVYFSEEEWQRLEEWQKELYKIVLKEIHEALISLGYAIANPDVIFRIKKEREPCLKYRPCVEGCPIPKPDVLLRIKQEEAPYSSDPNNSEESITITSTDHPDVASVFTLSLKQEENQYYIQDQDLTGVESIDSPSNDRPVTQYHDWYYGTVMEGYNEAQEQLKQVTKNVKGDFVKVSDDKSRNRGHNPAYKQKAPSRDGVGDSKDSDSEEQESGQRDFLFLMLNQSLASPPEKTRAERRGLARYGDGCVLKELCSFLPAKAPAKHPCLETVLGVSVPWVLKWA